MRPGAEVLAGRTRKALDVTTPTPESHAPPTSFFMATEEMLDRASAKSTDLGSDSTFGIRSLQETICEVGAAGGNGEEEDDLEDDEDDKEEDDNNHETKKGKGPRRRSTLKPKIPTRDSSPENLENVRPKSGDSSQPHLNQGSPSYPSASQSLTSLSPASLAQGLSLPSSPKSTSTRSPRNSDEESMDDGGSQAILSSEDDEVGHAPETQETAPQLIMPSIKMPSRRPFTERGKAIDRLKILIAGDTGRLFMVYVVLCVSHGI